MTLVSSLHQKFTLGLQCRAERSRKVFFLSCSFRLVAQFAVSPQFHSTRTCDSIVLMELDQPTRDRIHSILYAREKSWNAAFHNQRGVNWVVARLLCKNFQTVNLHTINISDFILTQLSVCMHHKFLWKLKAFALQKAFENQHRRSWTRNQLFPQLLLKLFSFLRENFFTLVD